MSNRELIVSHDDFDSALAFLRDSAKALGDAKARAIRAGHMVKYTEALMFKASAETSDGKRQADARSSDKYLEAVTEDALAAGELAKLYGLREAAAMKCEAWRTEQATLRSLPRIHG